MADKEELANIAVVEPEPESPEEADAAEVEAPAPEEEIDYKAEAERLASEKAALEHKYKSLEGRLKTTVSREVLGDIQAEMRALKREVRRVALERDDLDDSAKQERLSQLEEEAKLDAATAEFRKRGKQLADRINRRLERSSIGVDHPKVQDALKKWNQSRTLEDLDEVYDELDDFIDQEVLSREKEKAETERKKANQRNGTMAVGTPRATPAGGMSDEEAWAAYGRGEIGFTKQVQAAGKALGIL